MTKLFLGLFDITISLFVYLPFAAVCITAFDSLKKLWHREFNRKNTALFAVCAIYIAAFVCIKVYKPDFLAPMFFSITCLIPVLKSSRELL